ncbi:MAG TPA: NUDIX hydrolase [Aggregatilinea sp.]|jgi:8-oxo-dGTP pyrophosphatase MutT (NUDIX family)|uniref:NUDIX hydrolase n=1 Tax=Aggregatilinea sp. TaxID=2806333 RepID=UPI002C627BA3|nr:NUDIX hydrolase [Aggregatilinea sp.]HML22869.1 NUDIX hydrolase [Aggregatilinea sp.]
MKPWDTLSHEILLDRMPWLRIAVEHVRLPSGHEIEDFHRIEMPEWAQVFAVVEDGRVAMIEHYKHGPRTVSLELPAGYLDAGEAPDTAARRELYEETGLEADDLQYLGRFFIDGNRGCGGSHIFVARHARQVSEPHLEASEDITQRRLALDDVRAACLDGRIKNIATVAAIGLAMAVLENKA